MIARRFVSASLAVSLATALAASARAESVCFVDRNPALDALAGAALVRLGATSMAGPAVRYDGLGRTWVTADVADDAEVGVLQRAALATDTPFIAEAFKLETGALAHHVAVGMAITQTLGTPPGESRGIYLVKCTNGGSGGGGPGESDPPEDDSDSGGSDEGTGGTGEAEETCVTVLGVTLCI